MRPLQELEVAVYKKISIMSHDIRSGVTSHMHDEAFQPTERKYSPHGSSYTSFDVCGCVGTLETVAAVIR